jgi:hypothetical protein
MSPDDGDSKDLWNVGNLLPDCTTLQPRRQQSSYSPPYETQILQKTFLLLSCNSCLFTHDNIASKVSYFIIMPTFKKLRPITPVMNDAESDIRRGLRRIWATNSERCGGECEEDMRNSYPPPLLPGQYTAGDTKIYASHVSQFRRFM